MPVTKSEEEGIYNDGKDPEIEARFEGFNLFYFANGVLSLKNTVKQGHLSGSSHLPKDIIFCKEFPTWPTDVWRRLNGEYRIRIGAKPFSSSITGVEEGLPRPVVVSASNVDFFQCIEV